MTTPDDAGLAARVIARLRDEGNTLAVAESLTGGLLAARLVDVPGASAVLRGGVVAYATDLKHVLLGVDDELLAAHGAVHPDVAAQMATGVRERLGATWGLATTGVAGPAPQDGRSPGTVHLGIAGPGGVRVVSLVLDGDRATIRRLTVDAALGVLLG
ncbi:MAG: nicotinamide-nucleotide amidase [Actinomycetota bacterium]|nr:nicotinamide-nucleotide amidase [Actinomycetota bacterium]